MSCLLSADCEFVCIHAQPKVQLVRSMLQLLICRDIPSSHNFGDSHATQASVHQLHLLVKGYGARLPVYSGIVLAVEPLGGPVKS